MKLFRRGPEADRVAESTFLGELKRLYQHICRVGVLTSLKRLCSDPIQRRKLAVWIRIQFGLYEAKVKIGGLLLHVDLRDKYGGREMYLRQRYDSGDTSLLTQVIHPGTVFLDIGAHIGYFATLFAQAVGENGKVIACEPESYNYSLLTRNVQCNKLNNVLTCRVALGNRSGTAELAADDRPSGDHRLWQSGGSPRSNTQEVEIDTVDSLLDKLKVHHVDVVKMDVQGYEWHVLQGMETTLKVCPPQVIFLEFWPHGILGAQGDPSALYNGLCQNGYRAFVLDEGGSLQETSLQQLFDRIERMDSQHPESAFLNVVFRLDRVDGQPSMRIST
jgi:FkbM family methyltransferase